jgi:hypothetical protein
MHRGSTDQAGRHQGSETQNAEEDADDAQFCDAALRSDEINHSHTKLKKAHSELAEQTSSVSLRAFQSA